MRVEFNYTIEDIVDVQMRMLKRSRAATAWRWRDLILASLLSGIFVFAIIPEDFTVRIIAGAIGLLAGAALFHALNDRTVKRRLRKWCEEQAGADKTFTCEVELSESGVQTKANGTQTISPWENAKEIKETADSVDIYFEQGGLLVVRNRAFTSPEEHQLFIETANQYLKAHKSPQPA